MTLPYDDMSHGARVARYADASAALSLLGDRQLAALLDGAQAIGSGIGGTTALLHAGGVAIFAKRVPLTDRELEPEHVRSTANLYGVPAFCQYGVISPGFNAWRELAANTMATGWTLAGRTASFPLTYHWRVLPGEVPVADEHADVDKVVEFCGGAEQVGHRLEALRKSTAGIVLFQEYVPQTVFQWLARQLAAGTDAVVAAVVALDRWLRTDVGFMGANGLMHFDAHFDNVLTDGRRLYFADLGLATSPRFDLSPDEVAFARRNATHDLGYAMMRLVNWVVTNVCGVRDVAERNAYVHRCAEGDEPVDAPPELAAIIRRYAPLARVMNDFYWVLFGESRTEPYPEDAARRAIDAAGLATATVS